MSSCADPKTMPVTREYADGHERIFGKREAQPGRWIYLPDGSCVSADEYVAPATENAINAPVMAGRFYENTAIHSDTNEYRDVGSRKRYREYLKETGTTHASDYREFWKKSAEKRERVKKGEMPSKTRREVLDRAFHKIRGY